MQQNRERLLQKPTGLGVGNDDPKSGKTVNIHGKFCRERPVGTD